MFGQGQLAIEKGGEAHLKAYLTEGTTDFEHDSAYALCLPLVGVSLERVLYHRTMVRAWVSSDPEYFRVPASSDYSLEAEDCEAEWCRSRPHKTVPEGLYSGAPFDEELFRKVRGLRVMIHFSPA